MDLQSIKSLILTLPEVGRWPELASLVNRAGDQAAVDWQLPLVACEAVGGRPEEAASGAAAILCLQASILLVDDILDDDPRGEYHRLGVGRTANLALALEAVASQVVSSSQLPFDRRAAGLSTLASMAVQTAFGQDLDVSQPTTEDEYWTVVRAKSTPFYGAALKVGAQLGGAEPAVAEALYSLGVLVGEIVQLQDDLYDAFETPAKPDWDRPANNLLILYARTASYPDHDLFLALAQQAHNPQSLGQAQEILIRCGAVSFCAFHIVQRHQKAHRLLGELVLPNREPLLSFLTQQAIPIRTLFQRVGADVPEELR